MASVSLREIKKSFGQLEIIHGLSAEITDGEFVVIVGPSGCGKSTVLRLIAGLERLTAGSISIGERVIDDLEPKDRDVAMVFQNYALYPHMSVFDNMAYGLKVRGLVKAEIERKVAEAAGVLGLGEFLKRKPRQLSGGQRQRVAMGRAIVREPSVFLFDEPLSNLDAKLRNQMRVELKRLHHRLRTTSVYVTHDQVEAMTLADRIMVLNAGRVEQMGRPEEIYHRPATRFVARFIGSPTMNMLPARLSADGTRATLAGGLEVALAAPVTAANGPEVLLGIRPEHLSLATGQAGAGACLLQTQVDLLEPLGSDYVVHCEVAGEPFMARLPGTLRLAEGEKLCLAFDPGQVHFFEPESGRRLG